MSRVMPLAGWAPPFCGWLVLMFATAGTSGPVSAMAVALTPVVAVVLTAALIVAAGRQRRVLAGTTLGVLMWAMLVGASAAPLSNQEPNPRAEGPASLVEVDPERSELVVSSSNVRAGNTELEQLIDDLRVPDPDVILLQEIGSPELDALRRTDLASTHPHEIADPRDGFFGGAVYSRWPMTGVVEDVSGYPMLVVEVDSPYGVIEIVNVHVAPPLNAEGHRLWVGQLATLEDRLGTAAAPLVMVGDFNATPHHRELRRLADVTSAEGLGAFMSFPASLPVPPVLALDHAFAGGGACVDDVEPLADNSGSDHRAMRVIVRLDYSCPLGVSKLDPIG